MRKFGTQSGFTLVEMLVVISIMIVAAGAVSLSIQTFYRANATAFSQALEIDNGRRGLNRMIRDIREMTYADNGSYPLVHYATDTLSFYSDIDRDQSVEFVTYTLSDTTLTKEIYGATGSPPVYNLATPEAVETISEYVQNVTQGTTTFAFFTGSLLEATSTTDITDIRYITARLIINVNPISDPGEFTVRSSAAPRNLKDNL